MDDPDLRDLETIDWADRDWSKVALVLNVHARRYSAAVQKTVRTLAPKARLYVTHTLEEAQAAAQDILDNRFKVVFSGGGDGTLVGLLSMLREKMVARVTDDGTATGSEQESFPTMGVLRLGTGNGWAYAAGITKKLELLKTLLSNKRVGIREYPLIERERSLFPFGGLGWDGGIINDYNDFKNSIRDTWFGRHAEGLWAYLATVFLRTIPREMKVGARPQVKVEAIGAAEFIVPTRTGSRVLPLPENQTLYEGSVSLCAAGTIPYYGYRFKAFPHIEQFEHLRHNRFEFRVYDAGPLATVAHLGAIWSGRDQSPRFQSFLAEKVRLHFSRPVPMQLGGDAAGLHSDVEFALADFQVPMLVRTA